jgi:hypothetical protein
VTTKKSKKKQEQGKRKQKKEEKKTKEPVLRLFPSPRARHPRPTMGQQPNYVVVLPCSVLVLAFAVVVVLAFR